MAPDLSWVTLAVPVAVGIGLAAATGLRVFLPLLILGGAARAGWLALGPDFGWLASNAGLTMLAVATVVEVAAYYVPVIDNAFDVIAGPVAILAGTLALAAVTADLPAPLRWSLAIIAGGSTAGLMQTLTTVARLKSTGLTGGLANPVLATFELVGAAGVALLAIAAPLVAILVVLLFIGIARRARRAYIARRQRST